MSEIIKKVTMRELDTPEHVIYPRTSSDQIIMSDGRTLHVAFSGGGGSDAAPGWDVPEGEEQHTVFNANGSISVTYRSLEDNSLIGTLTTVFEASGDIVETWVKGDITMVKTTVFNSDGSITVTVERE